MRGLERPVKMACRNSAAHLVSNTTGARDQVPRRWAELIRRGGSGYDECLPLDLFVVAIVYAAVRAENLMEEDTITQILAGMGQGDDDAMRALMPRVYGELRRLAATHLGDDRRGHTLQPTALVNEAFVRLADTPSDQIAGRVHFFRLASKVMRQVLIDHARARDAAKRGGDRQRVTLDGGQLADHEPGVDLLALEGALCKLEEMDPRMAHLVELRFFGGLSEQEAAGALDISRTQAARDWRTARAWLASELA